jgi:hypothetical protein
MGNGSEKALAIELRIEVGMDWALISNSDMIASLHDSIIYPAIYAGCTFSAYSKQPGMRSKIGRLQEVT